MPTMYAIPAELLDGLRAYLSTRPYREVAQAMQALDNLMEVRPVLKTVGEDDDSAATKSQDPQ